MQTKLMRTNKAVYVLQIKKKPVTNHLLVYRGL